MTDIDVQDIWYKSQRVLRTIVQVGIPAFLGFALVLPQIIVALGLPVDGALYAWLIGAAGVVTAVAAGLSRVMAIPAVNTWLTNIGLGSVPKSAVATEDLSHLTVNGEAVESASGTSTATSASATTTEAPGATDVLVEGDGLNTDQTAK